MPRFKSGIASEKDDPKTDHPSTSKGNLHIEEVRDFIRKNCRSNVHEIAKDL
ncbi:hypothetical protein AVEN_203544-1, partial [Araneus ventricosus]